MTSEAALQQAVEDGSLDSAEWPKTLQYILDRLDEIIVEFPRPPADTTPSTTADLPSRPQTSNALSSQESHTTDKENAPPATPPRPPVPAFATPAEPQSIPDDITTFYASIRTTLSKNFPKHPPHTVQRLAELVLEPKRRYKYLPAYLRALDRVVSVSSPLTIFPLPQAVLPTAGGLLNGTASTSTQSSTLGSDESLGGALLTPIPWLQNRGQSELISESTEMVDGPNGAGRIETVTVGMLNNGGGGNGNGSQQQQRADGPQTNQAPAQIASSHPDGETLPVTGPVTQGELLRQEQEAGIVLNNPHTMTTNPLRTYGEAEGGHTIVETVEGEEEIPHARGPEVIGMEDTGPQKQGGNSLNIEGAIGRPSVDQAAKGERATAGDTQGKDTDMKEGDASAKHDEKETATEGSARGEDVEMKSGD